VRAPPDPSRADPSPSPPARAASCVPDPVCTPGERRCQFQGGVQVQVCSKTGIAWNFKEDCLAAGKTCAEGTCAVTNYGPCIDNGDTLDCANASEHCEYSLAPEGSSCVTKCQTASDCPIVYPEGPDYQIFCDFNACMIDCQSGPCPPGMECEKWESSSTFQCVWL
jgi:hypothetical protein